MVARRPSGPEPADRPGTADPGDLVTSSPSTPPTVREAARIGGFAQARLVAGEGGLDRTVEWVRTMETPEIVRMLRPGDLLLTAA